MSKPSPPFDRSREARRERANDLASLMQYGKQIVATAQVFATVVYATVFFSAWGDARLMWLTVGLYIFATIFNILGNIWMRFFDPDRAQNIRLGVNLIFHIPLAVLGGWNLASWLWVLFFTGLAAIPPARDVLPRILFTLAAFNITAALTGGRWQDALVFTGISLYYYAAGNSYLSLLSNLLLERDRNLRDLHEAHQRGIAQEKLASVGQIAAGVAHEINNPMCFVTANVEALLEDLSEEKQLSASLVEYRDEVLPETIDGIRRVNSIVDDLRRFARGEPEHFVSFDLTAEISAAARMARTQMKPGQELDLELPASLDMTGSPRQLCQVVLNLLMNGLQALPQPRDANSQPGRVTLTAKLQAGTVEIAVRDNGTGMTEETKRRLFEPFFTTKAREGVGLGLSVVYGIVKAHGGTIDVESAPGRGTCFHMHLPCVAREQGTSSSPDSAVAMAG